MSSCMALLSFIQTCWYSLEVSDTYFVWIQRLNLWWFLLWDVNMWLTTSVTCEKNSGTSLSKLQMWTVPVCWISAIFFLWFLLEITLWRNTPSVSLVILNSLPKINIFLLWFFFSISNQLL
jgi:hypothetical protein